MIPTVMPAISERERELLVWPSDTVDPPVSSLAVVKVGPTKILKSID